MTPRGLPRSDAAEYIGCSTTKFDELVLDGRMPQPRLIDSKRVWDKKEIDAAFDALPKKAKGNSWDAFHNAA